MGGVTSKAVRRAIVSALVEDGKFSIDTVKEVDKALILVYIYPIPIFILSIPILYNDPSV